MKLVVTVHNMFYMLYYVNIYIHVLYISMCCINCIEMESCISYAPG